jgi:hypothetical protein
MFIKCDDLHSTNMEPLKCDKVYMQFFFFPKNVYKLQAIVLNLLTNNNNTFANGFILS